MFSGIKHNQFITEAKEREPEVLFVGDSLIQQLALTEVSLWPGKLNSLESL